MIKKSKKQTAEEWKLNIIPSYFFNVGGYFPRFKSKNHREIISEFLEMSVMCRAALCLSVLLHFLIAKTKSGRGIRVVTSYTLSQVFPRYPITDQSAMKVE